MKNALVLIVAFFALYFSASSAPTYQVKGQQVDEETIVKMLENKFCDLVQNYRQSIGRSHLRQISMVGDHSRAHASNLTRFNLDEMLADPTFRKTIAHENYQEFRAGQLRQVVEAYRYKPDKCGEIVYWAQPMLKDKNGNIDIAKTAKDILTGFLNSPGHKAIIEDRYATDSFFGTGVVVVGNRTILVSNFIGIKN